MHWLRLLFFVFFQNIVSESDRDSTSSTLITVNERNHYLLGSNNGHMNNLHSTSNHHQSLCPEELSPLNRNAQGTPSHHLLAVSSSSSASSTAGSISSSSYQLVSDHQLTSALLIPKKGGRRGRPPKRESKSRSRQGELSAASAAAAAHFIELLAASAGLKCNAWLIACLIDWWLYLSTLVEYHSREKQTTPLTWLMKLPAQLETIIHTCLSRFARDDAIDGWWVFNMYTPFHLTLGKGNGKLWEFIRDLLLDPITNPSFIRWERREDGIFKFVQSDKVAKLWGQRKQNPRMTYEKLSRAMR